MASEITLYDIANHPSKPPGWNPMVSKARYSLNFKGIPYKTIWLEYPDIEPTMRSIGAKPTITAAGTTRYTLPVIVDPSRHTSSGGNGNGSSSDDGGGSGDGDGDGDGGGGSSGSPTVVSDSWEIAQYLDTAYPTTPRLIPHGTTALQMHLQTHIHKSLFIPVFAPILVPQVMPYLNEPSRLYWRQTREAFFGKKLEDLCPKGSPVWDQSWSNLKNELDNIAALLDKNNNNNNNSGDSPFVMGNTVTFCDFAIVSLLDTIHTMLPQEWEKVKTWNGGRWEKLRDRCSAWRNVH